MLAVIVIEIDWKIEKSCPRTKNQSLYYSDIKDNAHEHVLKKKISKCILNIVRYETVNKNTIKNLSRRIPSKINIANYLSAMTIKE